MTHNLQPPLYQDFECVAVFITARDLKM